MKPTLIIFAKAPRMGVSKTRLAAGIGVARAWRVKRTLDAFTCRIATSPKWTTILAVGHPRDVAAAFPGAWPNTIARIPQGRGDLGKRMATALRAYGRDPVCIIGTDLPDLRTSDINSAFQALASHDVVIGPATDGGYWLIGLSARAARRANLGDVRWSTQHTRADTLATLPKGWRVALLREMEDVDDAASFRRSGRRQTSR
jgi:uncharacterized protein